MRVTTASLLGPIALPFMLFAQPARGILPPPQTQRLYVSNWSGNTIGVYESDGSYSHSFSAPGLVQPRGIAFLPDGSFLVASQTDGMAGPGSVFRFDAGEAFVDSFAHPQLDGPTGMAIHGDYVYISSFDNDQVVVFEYDGTYVAHFGGAPLNGTNCIAFDSQGFAYVSSALTGTVIKYDTTDLARVGLVAEFSPTSPVQLLSPMSIARIERNAQEVLYVSGGSSHNIVKFSTSGDTLGQISLPGFGPQGIAFDQQGHFFTSSFFQDRILHFDENDLQVGDPITAGDLDIPRSLAFAQGGGADVPATSTATLLALGLLLVAAAAAMIRRRPRRAGRSPAQA